MTVFFDTMVAAHLLNEEVGVSLLNQASIELGVDDWGKGRHSFGDGDVPPSPLWGPDGMGAYCARDVAYSHLLFEIQRERLVADQDLARLARYLVFPGIEAVTRMELNGIWVDRERLESRRAEIAARRDALRDELLSWVPEDFRERADLTNEHFLRAWLFGSPPDGLGLEPVAFTEKTGRPRVDEPALAELARAHPAIETLMRFRKTVKALQFLDAWRQWIDDDGRMHPRFNMTGTVTGRRSCENPNLQQVPRDRFIRSIIGAPPGWTFLEVDYSMLEVRIAAWLANEDTMIRVFREGRDIYRYTSSIIYQKPEAEITPEERRAAKAVVLGFLYGMGAMSFVSYARDTFGVEFTYEEGERFRETFFRTYPRLVEWHERQRRIVRRDLRVRSPLGRVRHLTRVLSLDREERARAERQAINSPVQGLGGDLTLATSLSLQRIMDPDECMIVGDVHDALLFQIREDVWRVWTRRILETMENPPALERFSLSIPVRMVAEGKIGRHWGEGHEIRLEDFLPDGRVRREWVERNPGCEWLVADGGAQD